MNALTYFDLIPNDIIYIIMSKINDNESLSVLILSNIEVLNVLFNTSFFWDRKVNYILKGLDRNLIPMKYYHFQNNKAIESKGKYLKLYKSLKDAKSLILNINNFNNFKNKVFSVNNQKSSILLSNINNIFLLHLNSNHNINSERKEIIKRMYQDSKNKFKECYILTFKPNNTFNNRIVFQNETQFSLISSNYQYSFPHPLNIPYKVSNIQYFQTILYLLLEMPDKLISLTKSN
jgi:hypothetical protein